MLKLYNTLTRKKEEFKPLHDKVVSLYTCGPTVYDYAHIGNLRAYIFEDVLKRALFYNSYKVKHVMNITDVGHLVSDADEGEDKMMKALKREGLKLTADSLLKIADKYTKEFKSDIKDLNILEPDIWCRATEHIKEMIKLIQILEKKGYTYETKQAIYFDVSKFKDYTKLAKLDLESLIGGARIGEKEDKKNPADFVLWFKAVGKYKNHVMVWDSPWGKGFPGWHIECSAMSMKYLGKTIDIHCGGEDHIPVHHTNEIAQSEAATGQKFVRYWLHVAFLQIKHGKMAKSASTFITLKDLKEKGFKPLAYRYLTLQAHYRTPLNFTFESLLDAQNGLENLQNKILELVQQKEKKGKILEKYQEKFLSKINNDLDMPAALALAWQLIKDNKKKTEDKLATILDFDKILGLDFSKIKKEKVKIPQEIEKLVAEREEARKAGNWSMADELRSVSASKGYLIEDTPEGPRIKKK